MKKYIAILFIIILTFSGCKNDGEDKPHIPTPTDVLSTSDIKEYIDFEPVAEKSETENSKTVKYKNQTPGISDIVEVTVYSENKNISKAEIEEKFRFIKDKSTEYGSIIPVDSKDAECFIKIPSAYILKDGNLVVISAGSGGEEEQVNLLRELLAVAIKNIK